MFFQKPSQNHPMSLQESWKSSVLDMVS
jgi:hypothetical protein